MCNFHVIFLSKIIPGVTLSELLFYVVLKLQQMVCFSNPIHVPPKISWSWAGIDITRLRGRASVHQPMVLQPAAPYYQGLPSGSVQLLFCCDWPCPSAPIAVQCKFSAISGRTLFLCSCIRLLYNCPFVAFESGPARCPSTSNGSSGSAVISHSNSHFGKGSP
jgi:hypothetical protein